MVHLTGLRTGAAAGPALDAPLYLFTSREGVDLIKEIMIESGFVTHFFFKHLTINLSSLDPVKQLQQQKYYEIYTYIEKCQL